MRDHWCIGIVVWCLGLWLDGSAAAFQLTGPDWAYRPNPMGENWRICPAGMPAGAIQRTIDGALAWNYPEFQFTFGSEACLSGRSYPRFNEVNQVDIGSLPPILPDIVLAQTFIFFSVNALEQPEQILECDMRFNNTVRWYTGTDTPGATQFDWWSVAVHEMGHCLGLWHEDEVLPPSVMHSRIGPGEVRRQLTADDIAGRNALYGTPVAACPHDGDVNQDGGITPADALLAFQQFLGIANPPLDTCQQDRANVEEPETSAITPVDALCIFQRFLELPSCLGSTVGLELVATGLAQPVFITHAGDTRLFIVEQPGRIRILEHGMLLTTPFLDITPLVSFSGEQGLLSVAFHPNYGTPDAPGAGLLWVNYTDTSGNTVIARYTVSRHDANQADPASALMLLTIVQPFANHNGGQLQFGPAEGPAQQRYLYIGMGDGGSSGDPFDNAQSDDTLLGKMLRLDPSTAVRPTPPFYALPPDNPNVVAGLLLGTIWAKGLRNPWRFSFDARTGDLYIADVGQNRWEEVHVTAAGTPGRLNYGWRLMEGHQCFDPPNCDTRGLVLPVHTYGRGGEPFRCAIIGGYVYRGTGVPALAGTYVYADLCSGEIFGLEEIAPGTWHNTRLHTSTFSPLTFGEDVNRELYLGTDNGNVYQIVVVE